MDERKPEVSPALGRDVAEQTAPAHTSWIRRLIPESRTGGWAKVRLIALLSVSAWLAVLVARLLGSTPVAFAMGFVVAPLLVVAALWALLLTPRIHPAWSAYGALVTYLLVALIIPCLSGPAAFAWPVLVLWDAVC